jgi:YD repeat-containing protein
VTGFTYRADNQIETFTAPDGTVTAFTQYDASGNNTEMQIKDINGTVRKTVAMVYDGRNRLHTSTTTVTGQPAITATYDYDANDNPNYIQDPEGNETRLEYNYNHQQTKTTQYLNNGQTVKPVVTSYQYGASGCPTCNGGVVTSTISKSNEYIL